MKKALLTFSVLFIAVMSYCQAPVQISDLEKKSDKLYYLDGKLFTGMCYEKFDNGKIGIKGQMKNGKKDGLWTWWYSSGQKKRETQFVDGKKDGLTYYWYENGQKQKELMFKQDKNVDQKLWDEEGNRLPNPSFVSTTD